MCSQRPKDLPNAYLVRSGGRISAPKKLGYSDNPGIAALNYPLVMSKSLLKMTIEIVHLPIENGGSFHSYVAVYQRVY